MSAFIPLPVEDPAVVTTQGKTLITLLDEPTTTVMYIGKAEPGTATSAASWSIQKLDVVGSQTRILRAANGEFTQIWDNRSSLTYS